jgi:hypothetical protein
LLLPVSVRGPAADRAWSIKSGPCALLSGDMRSRIDAADACAYPQVNRINEPC